MAKVSDEAKVGKEIVEGFWHRRMQDVAMGRKRGNYSAILAEVYRVERAKPKDLVDDFKAIVKILSKAVEEVEKDKDEQKAEVYRGLNIMGK